MAQPLPCSVNADDSIGFCDKCGGRIVSDSNTGLRMAGNMMSTETIMLYDLEHAQKVLSGAALVDVPHLNASLEPAARPGKVYLVTRQKYNHNSITLQCLLRLASA